MHGRAMRVHARSLMEGLSGTAIRSAVRDPSCPQGPGPAESSTALVGVRGLILRVAATTTTHIVGGAGSPAPSAGVSRREYRDGVRPRVRVSPQGSSPPDLGADHPVRPPPRSPDTCRSLRG